MIKFLFKISLLIICALAINSCSEKDEEPQNPVEEKIEYYVKYKFKFSNFKNLAKKTTIYILTENGGDSYDIPSGSDWWEGTFGPFDKYETLYIKTDVKGAYGNLNIYAQIMISNGGPFVLKRDSHTDNQSHLDLRYTVTPSDLGIALDK